MHRSHRPEYVLGYIAGVINIAMASVLLISLFNVAPLGLSSTVVVIYALVFIAIIINFTGARACRINRVRGGVLMAATAAPMLIYILFVLFSPTAVHITRLWWMTVLMALWLAAQVLSIAAAVMCFMPVSSPVASQPKPLSVVKGVAEAAPSGTVRPESKNARH